MFETLPLRKMCQPAAPFSSVFDFSRGENLMAEFSIAVEKKGGLVRWFEERYTERVERAEHSMEKRETESLSVLLSNDCPSPFFVPNPRRESFLRERAAVKKEETVIKMCL